MDGSGGWKWSGECESVVFFDFGVFSKLFAGVVLGERKLFSKVVADAKITSWFNQNITNSTKDENG